jgi:cell wall-associated NlpC family hydrolase
LETQQRETSNKVKRTIIISPVIFLFMLLVLTLPGCSIFKGPSHVPAIPLTAFRIDLTDGQAVKSILYAQYNEWKSVQYRAGGMSKKGIDCSGFVYITYRSKFGIDLPRTTDQQSILGREVARNRLQPGDLVFFKTGIFQKHVGIFLEKRKFLHVSTSSGVVISNLDEPYWSGKYWRARRIYL